MAPFFKNKVVALSGTFKECKQAELKDWIESHGGTYSVKVTDDCTHLVTTEKDFKSQATKCKQAASVKGINIVSVNWILDSISSKKCVNESAYRHGVPVQRSPSPAAAPSARRTRSQAQSQSQSQSQTQPLTQAQPHAQPQTSKPAQTQPVKKKNKRTRSTSDDTVATKKVKSTNGAPVKKQKESEAEEKKLNIPVDECFIGKDDYHVYIDPDGVIYDAALNQTNRMNNNNKFYFIQLLEPNNQSGKYVTWTRWGRVGENGQSADFSGLDLKKAKSTFESKFKAKSGLAWGNRFDNAVSGKYMFLERDYEADSDGEKEDKPKKEFKEEEADDDPEVETPKSVLPFEVQQVVGLIFNQAFWANTMANMSYDAEKMPLGKLSKRTLLKGFELLKQLSDMVHNMQSMSNGLTLDDINNQYFTVIPHAFGRGRVPLINNQQLIKKEIALLETLTDMEIANEILKGSKTKQTGDTVHPLDRQFAGLGMQEMTPLDPHSMEFKELADYLIKTHGDTHYMKYKLKYIFRIERNGETDRFHKSPYANIQNSNRRLLWHGSRTTNYGGILSQGLRIAPPEAPVTGYMFGKGVYFADISSKSANYCNAYSSDNTGLLLLCDVELGDPMLELASSDYHAGERAKRENKLATLGMGRTVPYGWKDAGCVHKDLSGVLMPDTTGAPRAVDGDARISCLCYNEYIVYDVAQIRLKYLFCVGM